MRKSWLLVALGLLLMAINRLAGLVLPNSTRFLIDNVVTKHQNGMRSAPRFADLDVRGVLAELCHGRGE